MEDNSSFNFFVTVVIGGSEIGLREFSVQIIEHLFNHGSARNFLVDIDSAFSIVFTSDLVFIVFRKITDDMP